MLLLRSNWGPKSTKSSIFKVLAETGDGFRVCFGSVLGGGGRHYESEVSILDFWSVFGSPDSQFLNVRVMWRGGGVQNNILASFHITRDA